MFDQKTKTDEIAALMDAKRDSLSHERLLAIITEMLQPVDTDELFISIRDELPYLDRNRLDTVQYLLEETK